MRGLGINRVPYWNSSGVPRQELCCVGWSFPLVEVAGARAWWLGGGACLLACLLCWSRIGRGGACAGWAGRVGWLGRAF